MRRRRRCSRAHIIIDTLSKIKEFSKVKEPCNEEIVRLAALRLKIDQDVAEDSVSPSDLVGFKRGLAHLNALGFVLLGVAGKVLEGKPYAISSYSPETISRCKSLAEQMGAPVSETSDG
jgi:hypothetical protein